jgi:hypothetical protein
MAGFTAKMHRNERGLPSREICALGGCRILHRHRCRNLLGIGIDISPVDPIEALFWRAVINGFVAVPMMAGMIWVGRSPRSDGPVHGAAYHARGVDDDSGHGPRRAGDADR